MPNSAGGGWRLTASTVLVKQHPLFDGFAGMSRALAAFWGRGSTLIERTTRHGGADPIVCSPRCEAWKGPLPNDDHDDASFGRFVSPSLERSWSNDDHWSSPGFVDTADGSA